MNIRKCSLLAFGLGVHTATAFATHNADRVTGFYGVNGSTFDYRITKLWNTRRELLFNLANKLNETNDLSTLIQTLFKDDKRLRVNLSHKVEGNKLHVNLDVLNYVFNHQGQS